MKTNLFTACMLVLSVVACKKEIKLEVKQINETDKTAEWNISVNHPAFSTTEAEVEKSCVKYNDEITGLVKGIQAAFKEQLKSKLPVWILSAKNKLVPTNCTLQTQFF